MASISSKSKKPDLISIYRLEFYKNKKNWKFCNDVKKKKTPQSSCAPSKTKSARDLNKTYDVETICDGETETSPLNNAFMHEIPTDDTPENVPSAPPPTPQPPEKIWQHQDTKAGLRPSNTDTWVNRRVLTHSETFQEAQNKEAFTDHRTDAVQQSPLASCINQNQLVSNLQWLLQTNPDSAGDHLKVESTQLKPDFWVNNQASSDQNLRTQQQWSNQTLEIDSSSFHPQNIWTSAASRNPELFQKNSWSPPSPLPDPEILANLLKRQGQNVEYQNNSTIHQGPPANGLQMLLCPDKWKNEERTVLDKDDQLNSHKMNPGFWTNPALITSPVFEQNNHQKPDPYSWTNEVPSTPPQFSRRLNPDNWPNHQHTSQKFPLNPQSGPQSISQVSLTNQGSETGSHNLAKPEHKSLKPFQDTKIEESQPSLKSHQEEFKYSISSLGTYPTATWCGNQKDGTEQQGRMWNNPALSSNPEAIRPSTWSNEAWQKQEDPYLHQDWSPTCEELPNCECREEADQLELQYSAVDQNTLKPHGSLDSEMLTPEQIRQCTDEWLRRLLALHRPKDDCNTECETASDQNQGGLNDSTDFIREAHEVPHSSEKDPNETRESVCWCLPTAPLPALSSRRLSAALHHSAKVLREVLREQLIRDRLRSLTLVNVVEYPTRDTDLFGSEYVMGGVARPPLHPRPGPRGRTAHQDRYGQTL
ncbi:unnamed protein product [Arctia plantaginis]|uniref:Uncharacterized protein n=1 Tax=Arctia plantaginis TaxID=874455 RepID=A0A8S1AIN3_ARCPL|nr:unnamed protein product [Arctia plantaginis]